jgi:hypothetical protein
LAGTPEQTRHGKPDNLELPAELIGAGEVGEESEPLRVALYELEILRRHLLGDRRIIVWLGSRRCLARWACLSLPSQHTAAGNGLEHMPGRRFRKAVANLLAH